MNCLKYYLLFNPDLRQLGQNEIKQRYLIDICDNTKVYSIDSFFKSYPNFDINDYKKNNPNISKYSQIEILAHYHNNSKITLPENTLHELINNTSSKPTLAHIFVHFFKIGGGESYISNFNKFNKIFEETLFINKNYPTQTLFNYNGKIVLYNNYEELNKYLQTYDVIIDHQLYWFDLVNTKKTFLNIPKNKIIRLIHGVPIHFKNISDYEMYYSIELYTESKSHVSWNNHIKIYNDIGVSINKPEKIVLNTNNINIALVGRICEDKIPKSFIRLLIPFCKKNPKYIFNFYGLIDNAYKLFFTNSINELNNIIYHGIVNPSDIKNIYYKNDILLHPSISEAGATVILEAMSHGLPIICRNCDGMPNALYTVSCNNYLCSDEEEMLEKLLLINRGIIVENIEKIKKYNNEEIQFPKLIDEIKLIYYCTLETDIPNIIHYIFGLKKQTEEFSFVYYLSIYSNYLINKPKVIYFHYQYEPYGHWWDMAKQYVKLNYINTTNIYWGKKRIVKFAHKADKIRLDMLYKYGGIYMDIDTITYRSYHHLLKYDFVIGIQEENYGKDAIILYCNAILLAKRECLFIKKWLEEYETYFVPTGWCEASVHMPCKIFDVLSNDEKQNIKILEKECFYYPGYDETHKIFVTNEPINESLLTLHLWNTYSEKYYKEITDFNWCLNNNCIYANIIKVLKEIVI